MVARQAMGDAAAAIMADDGEMVETEGLHHLDLVIGHGALGVGGVALHPSSVWNCRRSRADPCSTTVCVSASCGRDAVPDVQRLRIAVQHQDRRTVAGDPDIDLRFGGSDPALPESVEHA